MEIVYQDKRILLAIKPAGVLSTDEPGGMPELIRIFLGNETACVRPVHRLDRVVSGLMLFARSHESSRRLSMQVQNREMHKEYLAVIHGVPEKQKGELCDLLLRNPREKKTYVVQENGKNVQEARLSYECLSSTEGLSLLRIQLHTGRTHQIRAQFSHRGLPLLGDKKYGIPDGAETIALWSHSLSFHHPETGENMTIRVLPPESYPWSLFPLFC